MSTIYLDLDGVVADFDAYTLAKAGVRLREFEHSQDGWNAIAHIKDDIYLNLEPMPDAEELVTKVFALAKAYKWDVGVLTAIPKYNRVPLAQKHKQVWLKKHFPKLLKNFNIGPHAVDKQWHCQLGDVLIDDSELNIPQWNLRGGVGILHTSAVTSIYTLTDYLEIPN